MKRTKDRWARKEDEGIREYLARLQRARDRYPLPARVEDLFNGNMLKPEYAAHTKAHRALERYHEKAHAAVNGRVDLTPGLRQAVKSGVSWSQLTKRYPWKVMWQRRRGGQIARGQKLCVNLGAAIAFAEKLHESGIDNATVVSRVRAYDVPASLRGKLPKKGFYWCPYCMKPRKFQISEGGEWFYATKKVWSAKKKRYVPTERRVALLSCPMCGCTNRDPVWRRSNQPWTKRRIKQGARRVSKRKRSRRTK